MKACTALAPTGMHGLWGLAPGAKRPFCYSTVFCLSMAVRCTALVRTSVRMVQGSHGLVSNGSIVFCGCELGHRRIAAFGGAAAAFSRL